MLTASGTARAVDSNCCTASPSSKISQNIPTDPGPGFSGTDCHGICSTSVSSGTFTVVCDLDAGGTPSTANAAAIYDPPGGSQLCNGPGGSEVDYCAWGNDSSGTGFYCYWDATDASSNDLVEVQIMGAGAADNLFLWWGSSPAYNMEPYGSYDSGSYGDFKGRLFGLGGDDELQGSRATTDYHDSISGGSGDDTLCGQAGDDTLNGNVDSDLLCGDADDDTLLGGGGVDYLCGYTGDNVLTGGAGNDFLDRGFAGSEDGSFGYDECTRYAVDASNCEASLTGYSCP